MSGSNNNKITLAALPVGYQFNEFEIKEVIGGGGFGIVYQVWDHQLERMIAIKEYMPGSMAVRNEDMTLGLRSERFSKIFHAGLNSFIQEARLLANFNHPCLLHVLRFWQNNGTAYMATLLYSGQTLKELQQKTPEIIDEQFIRQLLPPLFSALKTLHNAGYLHRDISLDNIQIQDNELPVLLDFGSARKEIGNLSDETEIMLKPGYAPIEQYTDDGDGDQGPWTDIYALGAVLYTLIVGEAPPVSVVRSIEDTLQPLAQRQLEGYSLSLLSAIDRALALAPADRPQTVDELATLMTLPIATTRDVLDTLHPQPLATTDSKEQERIDRPGVAPVETTGAANVTPVPRSLNKRLVLPLGALAIVLIVALLIHHHSAADPQVKNAAVNEQLTTNKPLEPATQPPVSAAPKAAVTAPATVASSETAAPAVDAQASQASATAAKTTDPTPTPVDHSRQKASTPAAAVANVYLQLTAGDGLTLDGTRQQVTPDAQGQVKLQLAAGEHHLVVERQGKQYPQSLTIDKPGVWFIAAVPATS
ncbi:serine/threonine-protein kinase [Serratia sp. M24T3]|uniref:serine/threonine protein kinase n=1 Tax=Serratia sp. M24T3 TaxID=932213 RepID=UPI00025B9F40|nr:serine/threonine-protein kinase [Serratia sp. M24T3]EIC84132.1 serine/threonine protein kinase [Serratia sp. M24T3]